MPTDEVSPRLWYLYMIRCNNGHLYTGVTIDVGRRFGEHQMGGVKSAKFLRGKGPLVLEYSEPVGTHSEALKREILVKKLSRKRKLDLISAHKQTDTCLSQV
ncbi:GIY-YIG nuclease family protein [Shewanella violacea]|uniref:GIY-YIG catalytic domain protein n=1 Tax=Shewanella violacea (strain JCM 10179 / CIP 106290 / LMG 19151 / DSS12) TaxID=637905 RepID=D4ZEC4_SHEVD|nr:GIY-YIG nuclease family protein [Shewanella violacea]BAJ04185.1 GIY-YIG catalytic domain protein [Shewanella violacea DSS12]